MNFIDGKWYCVGWKDDDDNTVWDVLIRYDGDGSFSGEDGDPIDSLFDPTLQCRVAIDAADVYQLQI